MASLTTYSSRNVKVAWAGSTFVGLAPDSAIEIAPNADITESEVGMDGSVMHSFLPNDTGTVTVRLMQNSPTNDMLSLILQEQKIAGTIVSSAMTLTDPSSIVASLRGVHIQAQPTVIRGSTATGNSVEWVFFVESIEYLQLPQGNQAMDQQAADIITAVDLAKKYFL